MPFRMQLEDVMAPAPDAAMDAIRNEAHLQGYLDGYLDGLEAFAHWRDGVQYVGTGGLTLQEAKLQARQGQLWNQGGPDYPHRPQEDR